MGVHRFLRGKEIVLRCLTEREEMTRRERKDYLRNLVRNSIISIDRTGSGALYSKFNWKVGDVSQGQVEGVCKNCLCSCYV